MGDSFPAQQNQYPRGFVTPQTMNQIVAGLESERLIERHPHPEHGRILQTALTSAGLAKVKEARALVFAIERPMLAQFMAAEKNAVG
jgi:DNA-binding MarR family transcriptional regulator